MHPGDQPVGPPIGVVRYQHVVPRFEQVKDGVLGRQPAGIGHAVLGPL